MIARVDRNRVLSVWINYEERRYLMWVDRRDDNIEEIDGDPPPPTFQLDEVDCNSLLRILLTGPMGPSGPIGPTGMAGRPA